jgi:hypothetical protein
VDRRFGGRVGRRHDAADVVERGVGRRRRGRLGGDLQDRCVVERGELAADVRQRLVLALEALDEAQPREVGVVVFGAGAGSSVDGQQALAYVVPDGARGDPGQIGQFGQSVSGLRVGGHGEVMTGQRFTVNTYGTMQEAPHCASDLAFQIRTRLDAWQACRCLRKGCLAKQAANRMNDRAQAIVCALGIPHGGKEVRPTQVETHALHWIWPGGCGRLRPRVSSPDQHPEHL